MKPLIKHVIYSRWLFKAPLSCWSAVSFYKYENFAVTDWALWSFPDLEPKISWWNRWASGKLELLYGQRESSWVILTANFNAFKHFLWNYSLYLQYHSFISLYHSHSFVLVTFMWEGLYIFGFVNLMILKDNDMPFHGHTKINKSVICHYWYSLLLLLPVDVYSRCKREKPLLFLTWYYILLIMLVYAFSSIAEISFPEMRFYKELFSY